MENRRSVVLSDRPATIVHYSAACCAPSNDGHTDIGVGKLNGRQVKVLRDTGSTGMIVDRALIPDSMVMPGSPGSLQMVDHHQVIDVPLANVQCLMCVSSLIYPVIIGNVRGARQMLPDPDWKAEDQKGARARTSRATTMTMTTKVVICLVGCLKRSPTERK